MATGTLTPYNAFLLGLGQGQFAWASDTIKVALLADTYTPDIDNHDRWDDVSAHEISGTGYTAGGATLASKTETQDNVADAGRFDAGDVTWASATFSARYGVIYKDTGTPSTSRLMLLLDFGAVLSVAAETFKLTWAADGVWTLT